MSIIITGSSGFVGKNLSFFFQNLEVPVRGLSIRGEFPTDHLLAGGAKALIHLAGKAHDLQNVARAEEYFHVNRDLTIRIFDDFLQSDIRDFFYFSSVKAAADQVEGVLDENFMENPKTPYGQSKLEAEKYLLAKELPRDKRLFIIRPCMIHGPGNKGNLNLLFKLVEKGIPWPLAAYENQRSFLGIDNLCFLIEQMINKYNVASGVYNFADDSSLSTNDLVNIISSTLGKPLKLWSVSPKIIGTIAKIGDVLPMPLNSERLKKLTESYVVSNQKIKSALGINKLPFTIEDNIRKTINSFVESKKEGLV